MAVTVISSPPSGDNYINDCAIWQLNITGQVDETVDERGLYRLMSDDGALTDWVSLPPVGVISVNFSKEISAALKTPPPAFISAVDATDMRKEFWLEYGSIVFDKVNHTKTENLGNLSGKSTFINGYKNPGQSTKYTMRPNYLEVPRYNYHDYIYSDAPSVDVRLRLCNGNRRDFVLQGAGDITGFAVGTENNPFVKVYQKRVVTYDIIVSGVTYKFKVTDGEVRAFNDTKFSTSKDRISVVMFQEPSGGYSCMPVEYLNSMSSQSTFQEICVYNGCETQNVSIFGKETRAYYTFQVRSPRTQQFGLWTQHFAAATKYFVLYKNASGTNHWEPFIVDSMEDGYSHEDNLFTFTGYIKLEA